MGDSDFGRPSFCRSGADFPSSDKGGQAVLETTAEKNQRRRSSEKRAH